MTFQEFIYDHFYTAPNLSDIKENIFFSLLPLNFDRGQNALIYYTEINESFGALDVDDYAQTHKLQLKVLSKDAKQVYDVAKRVKDESLLLENNDLRDVSFLRDIYLYEDDIDLHSVTMEFSIYLSESGIQRIIIGDMKPTKRYTWHGEREQDDITFIIPNAVPNEINEVIGLFVQNGSQVDMYNTIGNIIQPISIQYDNYVITSSDVQNDTIRFDVPVRKEADVHLVYR